ncbi:hypothetical protein HN777_01205 [Candidatus Woesearchaeota archaeon]|nr:hypothetical protein [Candidatus Woesearchaeota archaeon]
MDSVTDEDARNLISYLKKSGLHYNTNWPDKKNHYRFLVDTLEQDIGLCKQVLEEEINPNSKSRNELDTKLENRLFELKCKKKGRKRRDALNCLKRSLDKYIKYCFD